MTVKRIIAILLFAVLTVTLCACAVTEESGYEHTFSEISKSEKVNVYTYKDEGTLEIDKTEELSEKLSGNWEAVSNYKEGKKVLTISLGEHHEVTFFDNGTAVIYYGFATILEKDRCYYNVTLDSGLDDLYNWCVENGTSQADEQ